jgi:membrane fusion protein, multidrug efflux system
MADQTPPADPGRPESTQAEAIRAESIPADPAPTAPPKPAPPNSPPPEPPPPKLPPYWHRVAFIVGTIVVLFGAWQLFTSIIAYTDDAYVRSDLIAIAPEVTGRIIAVHVVDNQEVKIGDRLLSIDPEPFILAVNQARANLAEAKAKVVVAQDELATAQATLEQSTSAQVYAAQTQGRLVDLVRTNNAPRAELDKANDELRRAEAEMVISRAVIAKAQSTVIAQRAALDAATAQLATAEWRLSRTDIVSPAAGSIVNLTVRVGDTATAEVPSIGIVDASSWRIIANYKQDYIRSFEVGGTAWVWLDSQPWHFHRARIGGIARGISREPGQVKLLPYVAPTTDWIRLQRRIPVTLFLVDPPPGNRLYMGADARTVIFPW